jgi:plastocyanin
MTCKEAGTLLSAPRGLEHPRGPAAPQDAPWKGLARTVTLTLLTLASACGSTPTAPGEADATIVIGPAGVSPAEVRIKAWSRVMFINQDTKPHTIVSDPVDTHSDCPPINSVGLLNPGESRTTGTLHLERTCGFHDHTNQSEPSLRGRIIVN